MKKGRFFLPVFFLLFFFGISVFQSGQEDDEFLRLRKRMVKQQLASRDISDPQVLEVMGIVPRHLFVSPRYQRQAYQDTPLPIDEGQTISQPYIVALMTQHLGVREGEKVLEIGTGSGYQAAVLSHLTNQVFSIEIREGLAQKVTQTLKDLEYNQIKVKNDDGYFGWKEEAPFDAIIVTCAANHIPPPLLEQLKEGGRLIIPLGSTLYYQTLTLITKKEGKPFVQHISSVRFVPMVGEMDKRRK